VCAPSIPESPSGNIRVIDPGDSKAAHAGALAGFEHAAGVIERCELDLEPRLELPLLRPHPGHGGTGVAGDHCGQCSPALRRQSQNPELRLEEPRASAPHGQSLPAFIRAAAEAGGFRGRVVGEQVQNVAVAVGEHLSESGVSCGFQGCLTLGFDPVLAV
jgi:hypothetical protein